MSKRKADNTNRSTKLWMDCFSDFLVQTNRTPVDSNTNADLPEILGDVYFSLWKSKPRNKTDGGEYKNNTLMCICVALNSYFKEKRGINIISNENFVIANENFQAVTHHDNQKGQVKLTIMRLSVKLIQQNVRNTSLTT